MANKRIRSYEVSVWTLQDSFITVLKPFNLENRDQIQDGKMTLKDDGTRELSFSIPMYLYDGNEKKENPLWYNTLNGNIIADLRKIKVIFNKNEREEKVFEFLITKVTERHEDEQLICEVDCEGLAFHELGKTGYRISLNQDDFLEEWANWFEAPDKEDIEEPKNNLKYWADKILKNTNWVSEICMDWAGYDGRVIVKYYKNTERVGDSDEEDSTYARIDIATVGDILLEQNNVAGTKMEVVSYEQLTDEEKEEVNNIRARNGLRLNNVIYEDGFVSSWDVQEEYKLVPTSVEKAREKYRVVNKEESNRYNLLMEVAEIFGVFCKFVYEYDGNYHIIKRKVIFYNNFLQEATGTIDLTYPYNTNHIEREMDGTDIITKMFVKPLQDDTFDSNWASITETEANRSLEDYLLNFDYLYQIGTITRQQYEEIPKYEAKMREFNEQLIELNNEVTILENELVELEANETFYGNAIKLDEERISAADDLLRALTNDTGVINITKDNPAIRAIISDGDNKYISLMEKGIKESSVEVYADSECTTKITYHVESSCYDSANNLEKIYVTPTTSEKQAYLIYIYEPRLYYENIRAMWQRRLIEDENNYNNAKNRADTIGGTERDRDGNRTGGTITNIHISIDELLEEKQKTIDAFERMMGPALREGSWQPEDDYARYGDKRNSEFFLGLDYKDFNDDEVSIGWDTVPFDEERKNYYEVGADKIHKYYPCIDLSDYLNRFIKYDDQEEIGIDDLVWNKLSFIYYDINTEDEPIDGEIPISKARFFGLNSQCEFAFLKNENNIIPVLMITGVESIPLDEESEWTIDIKDPTRKGQIGYYQVEIDENNNIKESIQSIVSDIEVYDEVHNVNAWINHPENHTIVYPRIKFKNNKLHTSEDEFIIKLNDSVISNYQNYSLLTRDDGNDDSPSYNYYATIKNNTLIREGAFNGEEDAKINLAYTFSNTSLPIYLDAIQVLKENAFPRVEYTIDPTLTNPYFSHIAYDTLNKIVHINDDELKFENVLGYISELELDLDHPWEDSIKITNYKTKFEDLFSSIVASTEEMKKNSYIVGMAAKAFTTTGELNTDLMQGAVNDLNLKYAFDKGNLTIDSKEGIWGSSEDGVVAFRGGGIFTANEKDSSGEWIWNTGILPQGINASAITTGRLDTNLIRVYAGDNLRLQMNGDGLVAYKGINTGDTKNDYVIHNEDGLFLMHYPTASSTEPIKKVSVSWNGLELKNNSGETVFSADNDGDLTIAGTFTSESIFTGRLSGASGDFEGAVTATSLIIKPDPNTDGTSINEYVQNAAQDSVDALEIGGRNLLRHTAAPEAEDIATTRAAISGDVIIITPTTAAAHAKYKSGLTLGQLRGQTLTLSFDARELIDGAAYEGGQVRMYFGVQTADRTNSVFGENYDAYSRLYVDGEGEAWHRYSYTATIPDDLTLDKTGILEKEGVDALLLGVQIGRPDRTCPLEVRRIKLEKGNKATDWTPAPEDVDAATAAAQSAADNAASAAAMAQGTANSAVTAAGNAQSTANSAVTAAATAQTAADNAASIANAVNQFAEKVHNGVVGLQWEDSNGNETTINNSGIKIYGPPTSSNPNAARTFFAVNSSKMGFYEDTAVLPTPKLYYENGNLYLSGSIFAQGQLGGLDANGGSWEVTADGHLNTVKTVGAYPASGTEGEDDYVPAFNGYPVIDFYSGTNTGNVSNPSMTLRDNDGNVLFKFADGVLNLNGGLKIFNNETIQDAAPTLASYLNDNSIENTLNQWFDFSSSEGLIIREYDTLWKTVTNGEGYSVQYNDETKFSVKQDKCQMESLKIGNLTIKRSTNGGMVWVKE